MKNKMKEECEKEFNNKKGHFNSGGGAVYFFGLVGAMVYFIQNSDTFWMGVLGVLKAFVWPAFAVYKLLEFLGL